VGLNRAELRANAYHEAGHAVVALCLGFGLWGRVKLWRHGVGAEPVEYGRATAARSGSRADNLLFLLAGIAAEQRHDRAIRSNPRWMGDEVAIWQHRDGEDIEAFVAIYDERRARAAALVEEQWRAIDAVARALLRQRHHVLSARRVARIVEHARTSRP
jgi:hypothetical protein